jgi:hypothetical protein
MHALSLALADSLRARIAAIRCHSLPFAASFPQDSPQGRRQRLAALSLSVGLQAAAMHGLARRFAGRS